jgi:hypothetical protein
MADTEETSPKIIKETETHDHAAATGVNGQNLTPEQRARWDYGGNPLAHLNTGESARYAAFGGEFQPGLYKPTTERKFANPAPLGLSAFALTTFVLSLINISERGVTEPNIIVSLAFGYGGFVQFFAGMWYVLFDIYYKFSKSKSLIHAQQGNGCGKHFRCYCSLILRWFLDQHWNSSHTWWIRHCLPLFRNRH